VKVSYHVFKDFRMDTAAQTDEEKLSKIGKKKQLEAKQNLYSFVSMAHHPKKNILFLGTTHRLGDILVEFDIKTKKFRSCGFGKTEIYNDPFDVKIHKGLTYNPVDDAMYFGTASLEPLSQGIDSAGGVLVRYDIATKTFFSLGRPTPGHYYQGTCFDFKRKRAYLFTNRENFAVYDMNNKKVLRNEPMGSTPHNGCIDDEGGVWGTHTPGRQGFYRYLPDTQTFEFPSEALPNAEAASNIMYPGAGPVDGFINGGDGYLYVATPLGELYQLEPKKGKLTFLGKPFTDTRLPGLTLGDDGWLYLSGGNSKASMLARYSRKEKRFEHLGVVEHKDGTFLHYTHEIVVIDGVVYLGETDNTTRSGYLWTCEL
jgi:hypothetical protein